MRLPFLNVRGLVIALVVGVGALALDGSGQEVKAAQTVHPMQMVHPIRLE